MKKLQDIELLEGKNSAINITDLCDSGTNGISIVIGSQSYTSQLTNGVGALAIGAVPYGLESQMYYVTDADGVVIGYGTAYLVQVEQCSGDVECATPCDASVTAVKLAVDVVSLINGKLSAIMHDLTLQGTGTENDPLGLSSDVIATINAKLSAVYAGFTLKGNGVTTPLDVSDALAQKIADSITSVVVGSGLSGAGVAGSPLVVDAAIREHSTQTDNPHAVTKAQVGLGNVDNTADINKPVSTATQAAIDAALAGAGGGGNPSVIKIHTSALSYTPIVGQCLWGICSGSAINFWQLDTEAQNNQGTSLIAVVVSVPAGAGYIELVPVVYGCHAMNTKIPLTVITGVPTVTQPCGPALNGEQTKYMLTAGSTLSVMCGFITYIIGLDDTYAYMAVGPYNPQ